MKTAIIHYWLVGMRGGEKVLEDICTLFPEADIFTHVIRADNISASILKHPIKTSFISRLPFARHLYQQYLPFMPLALEQLDLRGYELVISSESGPAKGVLVDPDTLHICYCHTPMRYLWNMYHDYYGDAGKIARLLMPAIFHRLRQWDYISAARVDHFIANSSAVAARISKFYRRDAEIIHPPVDVDLFSPSNIREDFFLLCGQLVPYKRADLAVEAFNHLGYQLIVIGEGSEAKSLKKTAKSNIKFLGWQTGEQLTHYYSRCRALVYPGEEDFGIVPLEAMASGRPVIAFDKGGVRDTVNDGVTGVLFCPQSPEGLISAIKRFEHIENTFDSNTISAHAAEFSRKRFRAKFGEFVAEKISAHRYRIGARQPKNAKDW